MSYSVGRIFRSKVHDYSRESNNKKKDGTWRVIEVKELDSPFYRMAHEKVGEKDKFDQQKKRIDDSSLEQTNTPKTMENNSSSRYFRLRYCRGCEEEKARRNYMG